MSRRCEVEVQYLGHVGKSLYVEFCDEDFYLPLSQITFDPNPKVGELISVDMPEWLAFENGFI